MENNQQMDNLENKNYSSENLEKVEENLSLVNIEKKETRPTLKKRGRPKGSSNIKNKNEPEEQKLVEAEIIENAPSSEPRKEDDEFLSDDQLPDGTDSTREKEWAIKRFNGFNKLSEVEQYICPESKYALSFKDDHYFLTHGTNHLICLSDGYICDIRSPEKNKMIPPPIPYIKDRQHRRRYNLYYVAVFFLSRTQIDTSLIKIITAVVMLPIKRLNIEEKFRFEDRYLLNYKDFSRSKEGILTLIWLAWFKGVNIGNILNVSDDAKKIKRYKYSGTVPTYKELTEAESLSIIKRWLTEVFEIPVAELDTTYFHNKFLSYLATNQPMSNEQFDKMTPPGSYFINGVAHLKHKCQEVDLLPYDENIVTPSRIINAKYEKPNFLNNEMILSDMTLNFLKVICGDSDYNLNIFRIFLRNSLTSVYEGRDWQSAVFLHGAPGTAKSVWAEVIKSLIPEKQVQEFSRTQNQFSASQLKNCSVLIVSDLQLLLESHTDIFRRILGRDQLASEEKHVQGIEKLEPYCQVIIISNEPPTHYKFFKDDQALLDKLIPVYLGQEMQIDNKFQIANTRDFLDFMCSDLYNWAVYCRRDDLQYYIRAIPLQSLFNERHESELTGIPGFIHQCMFKSKRSAKIKDIKAALVNWNEALGEPTRSINSMSGEELSSVIIKIMKNTFGFETIYKREWMDKEGVKKIRPWVIENVECTDGRSECNLEPVRRFLKEKSKTQVKLSPPFSTDKVVCWMNIEASQQLDFFIHRQKEILVNRKESDLQRKGLESNKKVETDENLLEDETVKEEDLMSESDLEEFNK